MNAIAARARPRPALCKVGAPPEGFSPKLVKTPQPSLLLAMAKEAAAAVVLQDEFSALPEGVDNGDSITARRLDNAAEMHRVRAEALRAAISSLPAQDLAEGAVQLAYGIDRLGVLVDCATFSENVKDLAREHREALDRLLFSVLRLLEREAGVSRAALGTHELAPEHLDPWADPREG
ncbi:hypothetical protein [Xanthobacter aminoxidans]|uniref:hypothetical protein n=1 Tax=Xanthobacter aminoxidans TaxID=186280 RepID=UPI00202317E6|nr:hypothetical protein [Xanthobacter aminoxidans]MCL8385860.1 hypothetical protein [Xanthobacter aminoxidans]